MPTADVMLIIIVIFCFILVVAHRHRLVVLRRICLLMGLLYLMRAATIYITVLPVPDPVNMTCLPSLNSTAFKVVAARAFNFMLTGGLTLEGGGYLCGDYFFSGHTVILTMGALVIQEYTPKRWVWLHCFAWLYSFTGMFFILMAHCHYTVDILLAYYITTNLFRTYHTIANVEKGKRRPALEHYIWFPMLRYFESQITGVVPRHYEWPFPNIKCGYLKFIKERNL